MADYYPLLKRAIEGLGTSTPEMRQAIYGRARDALDRQLASFDPPLGEAELVRQKLNLEDVFRRIEAEQQAAAEPPDVPAPVEDGEAEIAPRVNIPQPRKPNASLSGEPSGAAEDAGPRPKMPNRGEPKPRNRKMIALAIFGILAMAGMGVLAITHQGAPRKTDSAGAQSAQDGGADSNKTENRLASGEAPAQTPAQSQTPPKGQTFAQSQTPSQASAGQGTGSQAAKAPATPQGGAPATGLPVASRAFMVMEANRGTPGQFEGRAVWSFAADPAAPGKPKVIRAAIDFAGAGLTIDFSIAKNTEAGVNASHIAMLLFEPKTPEDAVREMSAIEWRERENQTGTTFSGILVPIQDNAFMIGLDSGDFAIKRNLDLLRGQKWMVFEMRFANGRRGAVLVEKGSTGEAAVTAALEAWK